MDIKEKNIKEEWVPKPLMNNHKSNAIVANRHLDFIEFLIDVELGSKEEFDEMYDRFEKWQETNR